MPTFLIRGADRRTGADMTLNVEAADEREARQVASKSDVLVASIELLPAPVGHMPVATVVEELPSRRESREPTEYREYKPRLQQGHVRGAPVMNMAMPRRSNSSAAASMILGLVAFLICWIPLLGLLGVPLSGLGVLLAGIGFLVALTRGGAGIGYALGGGVVSGLALFVALSMNEALMGEHWVWSADRVQARALAAARETPETVWNPIGEWVVVGDADVQLRSVRVGKLQLDGVHDGLSKDTFLVVEVDVRNRSKTQKFDYYTWRDDGSIVDNFQNEYEVDVLPSSTWPEAGVLVEPLYPGETLRDVLIYQRPVDAFETLYLQLPGHNVGGGSMVYFEIPASSVARE